MKCVVVSYLICQLFSTYFLSLTIAPSIMTVHLVLLIISSFFYIIVSYKDPGYYNLIPPDQLQNIIQQAPIAAKMCKTCKAKQLLRTKHCYDCGCCVATFDHHCIWVSNCIGEKNRPAFICCLASNIVQITYAMFQFVASMWQKGEKYTSQIVFLSFLTIILSGIVVLFAMHCYLMAVNLTTWEVISWDKITYLSNRLRSQKSPFSLGMFGNVKEYWVLAFKKDFKIWNLQTNEKAQNIKFGSTQSQIMPFQSNFSETSQFK